MVGCHGKCNTTVLHCFCTNDKQVPREQAPAGTSSSVTWNEAQLGKTWVKQLKEALDSHMCRCFVCRGDGPVRTVAILLN
jgi:hypothetical protein